MVRAFGHGPLVVQWVVGSIPHSGPIELDAIVVPVLLYSCVIRGFENINIFRK